MAINFDDENYFILLGSILKVYINLLSIIYLSYIKLLVAIYKSMEGGRFSNNI